MQHDTHENTSRQMCAESAQECVDPHCTVCIQYLQRSLQSMCRDADTECVETHYTLFAETHYTISTEMPTQSCLHRNV